MPYTHIDLFAIVLTRQRNADAGDSEMIVRVHADAGLFDIINVRSREALRFEGRRQRLALDGAADGAGGSFPISRFAELVSERLALGLATFGTCLGFSAGRLDPSVLVPAGAERQRHRRDKQQGYELFLYVCSSGIFIS